MDKQIHKGTACMCNLKCSSSIFQFSYPELFDKFFCTIIIVDICKKKKPAANLVQGLLKTLQQTQLIALSGELIWWPKLISVKFN